MRLKISKVLYLLICFFFTALFLWLFFRDAEWAEIASVAQNSRASYIVMAVSALFPGFAARLWRWKYILKKYHHEASLSTCLVPYLASFAINNLLPFRLGDVARITLFNKQLHADFHVVTSSLVIERMVDFVSLLMIFCTGFFFLAANRIDHHIFDYIFLVSTAAFVGICVFMVLSSRTIRILECLRKFFFQRRMIFVSKAVNFALKTTRSIYRHNNRKSVMVLLMISLWIWLVEATLFWLVARSLCITLAGTESFFVMSLSTFSTLLPSTPGYVGTFHYLCRLALESVGTESSGAIVFSILIHMVLVVPVTVIGGFAFIHHFGSEWHNRINTSLRQKLTH